MHNQHHHHLNCLRWQHQEQKSVKKLDQWQRSLELIIQSIYSIHLRFGRMILSIGLKAMQISYSLYHNDVRCYVCLNSRVYKGYSLYSSLFFLFFLLRFYIRWPKANYIHKHTHIPKRISNKIYWFISLFLPHSWLFLCSLFLFLLRLSSQ